MGFARGSTHPTVTARYDSNQEFARLDDRWGEQLMRHVEAAQLVQAERLQRSTAGVCEIVAHDQRQTERLGDGFDAAAQIARRPDHREVEAVGRPDVAVD